jgi:DNA invertase Pin-like site-specific DNA recombinase
MRTDSLSHSKVTPTHQAKLAYVYVRQSSLNQVRQHGESTDMQYQLVERAVHLGWPRERVKLVDDDLGKSAVSADQRPGFQLLMVELGLGHVGLVMRLDASRLARNNSDWDRLIELCSMFGVLIADAAQLYDARLYHDRLLLGLSGMRSAAELHHLKVRLQAGARHKAERGALRHALPVGRFRQPDGAVILNPDAEVQARLRLIFAKVDALGSAWAVRDYLAHQGLLVPSRPLHGPAPHETIWSPARVSAILRMLHNPAYAGAYGRGRYGGHAEPMPSGAPRRGPLEPATQLGTVCLPNVYPAYISWETDLANGARLRANRTRGDMGSPGMPREGKALLQGIIWCGCCGRQMAIRYSGSRGQFTSYRCGMGAKEYGGPYCQEVRGLGLDAAVEQLVLAALAPERLVLALDALDQLEREVDALEHQWQLRLERVRYEAQRAQRQYDGVEPAHRLVARGLESQWEEKLRVVEQTEHDYATWKKENHTEITSKEREEILAIGEDLPRVWHAQTTPSADRKHLLRLVVKAVRVDQKRPPGKVCFEISWQGGARTIHEIDRLGVSYQDVSGRDRLQQRLGQLHAHRSSDAQVAQVLNAEGYRTAKGRAFRGKNVWYLRRLWGLSGEPAGAMTADGLRWSDNRYTVRGVAQAVGMSKSTVHRWLKQGRLAGEYLGARKLWRITRTSRQINILQKEVRATPCPSAAETITVN